MVYINDYDKYLKYKNKYIELKQKGGLLSSQQIVIYFFHSDLLNNVCPIASAIANSSSIKEQLDIDFTL
jgi:hypothetical protein